MTSRYEEQDDLCHEADADPWWQDSVGVSGSPFVADQLSYLMSGGITGLFLLGTGATFILLADVHDERRKLDRVETQLRRAAGSARPDE